MRRGIFIVILWMAASATCGAAAAEWYLLPADGASATFAVTDNVTNLHPVPPDINREKNFPLPKDFSIKTTLILRSVGKADLNGEACRWIEIKLVKRPGDHDPTGRILILKLLIPEQRFAVGDYPFSHVKKAYRLDSKWTETIDASTAKRIDENTALLQYELDRFLPSFPAPPKDAKWSTNQKVETGLGQIEATRADFAAGYEGKLSGGTGGKWTWQAHYEVWLSPVCPFGIVGLDCESANTEVSSNGPGVSMNLQRKMRLQDTGKNAVSELPNCE
jgi:hypothetical protein